MRLIDGDELIVKLYQDQPMDWTGSDAEVQELNDWKLFRNMVDNAPTVDAEIVVRCKDCEYSYDEISGLCCSHGFGLIAKCRRTSTAQREKERSLTNDSSRSEKDYTPRHYEWENKKEA